MVPARRDRRGRRLPHVPPQPLAALLARGPRPRLEPHLHPRLEYVHPPRILTSPLILTPSPLTAFLGALGHVLNTLLLTLAISELSGSFFSEDAYRFLSSLSLFVFGLYYLYTYFIARRRESCCEPGANGSAPLVSTSARPTDPPAVHRAAAGSLLLLTAVSPCVGSMPVLIAFLAPPLSVSTVMAAGVTMLLASAGVMMVLVAVSYAGSKTLDFVKVRRHERCILGVALIVLALLTFFMFSHHHHHHHQAHGVSHSSLEHAHHGHDVPLLGQGGKHEHHDCEHGHDDAHVHGLSAGENIRTENNHGHAAS